MALNPNGITPQPQIVFSETPETFGVTPSRGKWTRIGGVGVLRTATNIPREAAVARRIFGADKGSEVDSLPDVWSQVEGFADALYQANHERHASVVPVWRGLLACMALASDMLPNLYVRHIDLTAPTPFMRTASALPLRLPFLSFRYNGITNDPVALDEVGTLHLHRDRPPMAILQPISFVSPARSLFEALAVRGMDDRAPWVTGHSVEDPTVQQESLHRLSPAHFEILERYIQDLFVFVAGSRAVRDVGGENIAQRTGVRERLIATDSKAPQLARDRLTALSGLLSEFWKAAREAGARRREQLGTPGRSTLVPAARPETTRFYDPLYGAGLLQAFRTSGADGPPLSHTLIATRREAEGLFDAVVLADPQTALGDPQDVIVLDDTTVMHLREVAGLALKLQRNSLGRNVLVVTPDDLFTDTLVQIANGTVPAHARRGFFGGTEPLEHYVLPLTPLALLLFDSLAGDHPRLRLVGQGPDEIQAILTVPLKDTNGQTGRSQEIKKTFRISGSSSAALFKATQVDALALWPNLEDQHWNAFQTYSVVMVESVAEQRTLLPLWPIRAGALAAIARPQAGTPETAVSRALAMLRSWTQIRRSDEALPGTREIVIDAVGQDNAGRIQDRRLLQTAARPEAYIIAAPVPAELRNTHVEEVTPAGIVLVAAAPVQHAGQGGTVDVALDFGSTNTTIYVKTGHTASPRRVSFEARRLDVLRGQGDPARQHEFAPIDARPVPVSTVLERRSRVLSSAAVADEVGGGRAFVSDMRKIDEAMQAAAEGTFYDFNIKWLPAQLGLSRSFLRHIALLVLAEAAAHGIDVTERSSVNWHISYPSAYSGTHYRQFINGSRRVLGYFLPQNAPPIQTHEATESLCAARYFRSRGQGAEGGTTVVLDIGGGTSDIAVWQHQSETNVPLIWQSSVRFAGQQLVVEPIARNLAPQSGRPGHAASGPSILEVLARQSRTGALQRQFDTAVTRLATLARDPARDVKSHWGEWLNLVGVAINSEHFGATVGGAFADLGVEPRNSRVFDVMALGFAGLLWFIGCQLRAMMPPAEGKTKDPDMPVSRLDPNLTEQVAICLAGRPSRLLRDLIENRHGYEQAFGQVLRIAAGFGPEVRMFVHYTDHPKEEVAYGLLTDNLWSKTDDDPVGTILGEALGASANTIVPADRLLPRTRQAIRIHPSAPEMHRFLRCVGEIVTDRTNGMRFLDVRQLEAALPDLVSTANGALVAAGGPNAAGDRIGGDAVDDTAAPGPAPLTMEVQPPFFALLSQVMRKMQDGSG